MKIDLKKKEYFKRKIPLNILFFVFGLALVAVILVLANPAPITSVVLNSTFGANADNENLTVYVSPAANSTQKYFYNWYVNNASLTIFNMPMDGGTLGAGGTVRDYALGNNGTLKNGTTLSLPTYSSTGGYDGKGAYSFSSKNYIVSDLSMNPQNQITFLAKIKPNFNANSNTATANRIFAISDYNTSVFLSYDFTQDKFTLNQNNYSSVIYAGEIFVRPFVLLMVSDGTIFAGGRYGILKKSTDGGATFTETIPQSNYLNHLDSIIQTSDNNIYVGGQNDTDNNPFIQRSTDNGATWNPTQALNFSYSTIISMVEEPAGTLYVLTSKGNLSKTTNNGTTWTNVHNFLCNTYTMIRSSKGMYYVGGYCSGSYDIFNATDPSGTWNTPGPFSGAKKLMEASDGAIYALTGDVDLYKTTNGGVNWDLVSVISNYISNDITIMQASDGAFYYVDEYFRLIKKSLDMGVNWINISLPDDTRGYSLMEGPDGSFYIGAFDDTTAHSYLLKFSNKQLSSSAQGFSSGNWIDLAVSFGSLGQKIFINGVLDSSNSTNTFGLANYKKLWLGGGEYNQGDNGGFKITNVNLSFYGLIDEVRIFNKTLSNPQILALYNNQNNFIHSNETTPNEVYTVQVYPNDNSADGTPITSNNVIIQNFSLLGNCPASPQNWYVDLSVNPVISSSCNISGYNLTFTNNGVLNISSNFYVKNFNGFNSGKKINMKSGGKIYIGK